MNKQGKLAAKGTKTMFLMCLLWLFPCLGLAHDIPADITIQAFFKPEGQHLHYVVRVPMKAMRDIEFPKRGPGYLDMARVDEYLHDAAEQWISNFTEIDENDTRLPKPQITDARVSVESDRSFASYEP